MFFQNSLDLVLCDPLHCRLPGSSIQGDSVQTRTLEWVTKPSFRGSSQPRDWTQVSHISGGFSTIWATRKALMLWQILAIWSLVPLPFLACIPGSSQLLLKASLKISSITFLACEISAIVWYFEHFLDLPFFGIGMKTDLHNLLFEFTFPPTL